MAERLYFKKGEQTCSYNCENGKIVASIQFPFTDAESGDTYDVWVTNPSIGKFCNELGWETYEAPAVEPTPAYVPEYKDRVSQLIRERYTEDDEDMFARWSWEDRIGKSELTEEQITRMRDFSDYVEECKRQAKSERL